MENSIFKYCVKIIFASLITFNSTLVSADLNFKNLYYSAYTSYGDKWASYTFLEDRLRIPTFNITGQVSSGSHSMSINYETTIGSPAIEQVGVKGSVERTDLSFNISTRFYENFTPSLISTPYVVNYFYGYAAGKTQVNFDDGVWLNYTEKGIFAGLSSAWFFNKWQASLSASLSRGYWFNTTYAQRSSDLGIKNLSGISSGWSLSMNYSVPVKPLGFDSDVFVGFKSNNYSVVIEKQGEGLPFIRERLIFYYLGMSFYF